MASAITLALLLFAGVCSANITPAEIEEVPSLVQIEFGYSKVWVTGCAGSVLTNVHILSAARCFSRRTASINTRRIRAGASTRLRGGVISNVFYITNHQEADLSVVRLISSLVFSPTIQQGPIPPQGTFILPNTVIQATGWGFIEKEEWRPSFGLRKVDLVTFSNEDCQARYDEFRLPIKIQVNADQVCSGLSDEGGLRVEPTDAGSPAFYGNVIVSILSFGYPIRNTFPVVSTRVSDYTNWIVDQAV